MEFIVTDPQGNEHTIVAPEGATKEQALQMAPYLIAQKKQTPEDIGVGTEFVRGMKRGAENAASLVKEGVPALTKSLLNRVETAMGFEPTFEPQKNLEQYQKEIEETFKKYPTKFESIKDVDSLGAAAHYAASAAGEMIPSMATSIAGGGIGAMLAKQGVKTLAMRAGTKVTEEAMKKALIRGTMLGAVTASAPQNTAETYMNLLQGGKDAPMTALAVGGMKTALDTYTPTTLLGKVFGTTEATDLVAKNIFKRIGIEGVKAAPFEGLTEASQEALDIFAERYSGLQPELFTTDNAFRLVDAGLKGAIGGGVAGAITAPLLRPTEDTKTYQPKTELALEEVPDPTDATVMKPAYHSDETIALAKDFGVDIESLSQSSPEDISAIDTTIKNVDKGKVGLIRPTPEIMEPEVLDEVQKRQEALKTDPTKPVDFNTFVLGDGFINAGAQVNPTTVINKPEKVTKVANPKKLAAKANKVRAAKKPQVAKVPELPLVTPEQPKAAKALYADLQSAKPRYKNSELIFPSDLEKALYISTVKSKSKAEDRYRNWLKAEHGLTDAQINKYSNEVKNSVKKAHSVLPSAEIVEVPKFEIPEAPKPVKKRGAKAKPQKPTTPAKLQKDMNLPFRGNLQQDYVAPMHVAQNLWAMDLTEDGKNQFKPLVDIALRNVKEIAGAAAKVQFFKDLSETQDFGSDPIRGAQFKHTIAIALNQAISPEMINETSYHEAIHFLWDTAFSKGEKEILANNVDTLKAYALKDGYLSTVDFDSFKLTPLGREELVVNALAKMLVEHRQNSEVANQVAPAYRNAFYKVLNFLRRLGNGLRGLGFRSFDDIFRSVEEGKRAQEHLDEAIFTNAITRYQHLSTETQFANAAMKEQSFSEISEDAVNESNKRTLNSGVGMGIYGRYMQSIVDLASKDKFAGLVYDAVRRKLDNTTYLLNSYIEAQKDFGNLPKDTRFHLHSLADEMRSTKQKAVLDDEGYLTFKRGDKTLRIKDKVASQGYINMQNAYKKVVADWKDELVRSGVKTFKKHLPVQDTYTRKDFEVALAGVDKETSAKTHQQLTNLIEALKAVYSFTAHDFAPRMRFGSSGIAVKDSQGETVAFYSVEGGEFRKLFNKYQLEEAIKDIKEKYGDSTEYTVYDHYGKVKNLDVGSVTPFTMTHNNIKNHINTRFLNIEALSSLLFSKDMDQKSYEEMRTEVYNDILEKGFEKRFSESKNINGYSKDWDRAHHAYLSGASHFMAGLPAQEEFSTLKIDVTKLAGYQKDKNSLGRKLEQFLEYANSPQEDWQMTRTINFMWTMGGNLSTALLQTMTLPTTTLGSMNQYNPNMIQNMKYIGKWTKVGASFIKEAMKTISLKDGSFSVDFGDPAILDRLEKQGTIDKDQRAFIEKINLYGKWRGMETAASIGYKPFETRSFGGGIRSDISNVGQLLGIPTNAMEQMTRFATTMASFEMLQKNRPARERMRKVLATDYRFQAQLKHQKDMSFVENGALFNMDEAHAVFGKLGRVEYQRGIGGAMFFPFMTYPHQMLELLARMYGRSSEGKRALAMTVGAMFLLGGLMGLPGAELLKELLESLQKNLTGVEHDYDLAIRETITQAGGSVSFAKAVTQGIGRGYLGVDVSKRIGLAIPGQELLLSFLGIRSQPSAMLGVQGSIATGIIQGWQEYNQGTGVSSLFQAVVPVAASNVIKAYNYTQEGAKTKAGLQIVRPEDMSAQSIIARAMGITSDQIATGREKIYATQLEQRKYQAGINLYKKRAQNAVTRMVRAQKEGDSDEAKKYYEEYQEIMKDFAEFNDKYKVGQNFASFNRSIMTAAQQRVMEGTNYKEIKKSSRQGVKDVLEALGVK